MWQLILLKYYADLHCVSADYTLTCEFGWLSRYCDLLRAGRFGDRTPVGARLSALVHIGPEAHPASYTMGTASLSLDQCGWGGGHFTPTPSSAEVKERVNPPLGPQGLFHGELLPYHILTCKTAQ
jgi:hypothetical protein